MMPVISMTKPLAVRLISQRCSFTTISQVARSPLTTEYANGASKYMDCKSIVWIQSNRRRAFVSSVENKATTKPSLKETVERLQRENDAKDVIF